MNENKPCYIGKKPCGCILAATADEPKRKNETAKEIAEWIRDGMTIERVTTAYVRENFYCKDHKPKNKYHYLRG